MEKATPGRIVLVTGVGADEAPGMVLSAQKNNGTESVTVKVFGVAGDRIVECELHESAEALAALDDDKRPGVAAYWPTREAPAKKAAAAPKEPDKDPAA